MKLQITATDDHQCRSEPPVGSLESHIGSFCHALFNGLNGAEFTDQAFRFLAAIPVAVMVTDRDGVIEWVNERFSALTGFDPEEVCGLTPEIFKSAETTPERAQDIGATLRGGREWHGEYHNLRKNGEAYWEFSSVWPVTNEEGGIEHFLAISTDITERKAREAEQHRKIAELQQALALTNSLKGFISMCAWCKKVRDENRRWTSFDRYLLARSPVHITHGICPDCMSEQMNWARSASADTATLVRE